MVYIENLPEPMTKDEKEKLYRNWTDDSWKILAERNIRIAIHVAQSFHDTGIDEDDLFGIALIGLVKASKKFNPELSNEFSTYAVPTIRNEVPLEIRRNKRSVYCSNSLNELINFGKDGICELGDMIADDFNIEELSDCMGIQNIIKKCLSEEKERNRKIIICSLNGVKQRENGRMNGVAQAQVSRVLKSFKNKIKREILE